MAFNKAGKVGKKDFSEICQNTKVIEEVRVFTIVRIIDDIEIDDIINLGSDVEVVLFLIDDIKERTGLDLVPCLEYDMRNSKEVTILNDDMVSLENKDGSKLTYKISIQTMENVFTRVRMRSLRELKECLKVEILPKKDFLELPNGEIMEL